MTKACLGLLLLVAACRSGSVSTPKPTPEATQAQPAVSAVPGNSAAPVPPEPTPPALVGRFRDLEIEGFEPAVVSVPTGATKALPVLIALHGNYDRPEWQCEVYRDIVQAAFWVLCPRGVRRSDAPKSADRWTYTNAAKLGTEIQAGLQALEASEPDYVDETRPMVAGFSLGAILAASLLTKPEQPFERAIMVEGGFNRWNLHTAKRFLEAGGKRVLFAAGQASFLAQAKSAAKTLERAGVPAAVATSENVGHTYDGPVAQGIREQLPWLVTGDPRFELAPAPSP